MVNPLEIWVAASDAIFRLDKSYMTYFTRNKKRLSVQGRDVSLVLNRLAIKLSSRLKLLGVVLNQRLQYQEHISKAAKKGILATLALKRLKNPRPKMVKRLYNSTVVPVTDYVSVIWTPNASKLALNLLSQVQKLRAQAIVGAFWTMLPLVAELKASIAPLERQFLIFQLTTWVKWHSKPSVHWFWKIKRTIDLSNKRWISLLQKIAEKFKVLDLTGLEKIEAFVKAPWVLPVPVHIFDKEEAILRAKNLDL